MSDVMPISMCRSAFCNARYSLLLAGLVILSGGCGGEKAAGNPQRPPPSPAASSGERERAHPPANEPPLDPDALAPRSPEPDVSLSANGVGDAKVFRGWPLILEAGVLHPGAFQTDIDQKPMVLAAQAGPWTNALKILISDEDGQRQTWDLQLAEAPVEESFRLDAQTPAVLVWCLPPEESAKVPPGSYELLAVLNARDSTAENRWKGTVRSMPALVHLSDEPPSLSRAQTSEKHQLFAAYYFLRGDAEQATQQLEQLLKRQPADRAGWELKGDLLANAGKLEDALDAYSKALDAFLEEYGTEGEPPAELLIKQRAVLNDLFEQQPPLDVAAQDTTGRFGDGATRPGDDAASGTQEIKPFDEVEGWGLVVDPVGGCSFSLERGVFAMRVPGEEYNLWPLKGKVNAPLVLQEVEGDFTAEVLVRSVEKAEAGSAIPGLASRAAFHAGTLVIWHDAKNFVRLDRADMHNAGRAITSCYLHIFQDGERIVELAATVPDRPTHLRLARRGNRLTAAHSQDRGRTWEEFPQQRIELPSKVKVGISALNSTTRENTVEFQGLKVSQ